MYGQYCSTFWVRLVSRIAILLTHTEIERIQADLALFEKAKKSLLDTELQKAIDDWIADARKRLTEG